MGVYAQNVDIIFVCCKEDSFEGTTGSFVKNTWVWHGFCYSLSRQHVLTFVYGRGFIKPSNGHKPTRIKRLKIQLEAKPLW